MIQWILSLGIALSYAQASTPAERYYGHAFLSEMTKKQMKGPAMRDFVHRILDMVHVPQKDGYDELSGSCNVRGCYEHKMLGYDDARKVLLGEMYLVPRSNGEYGVSDLYCDRIAEPEEFPHSLRPGPGKVCDHAVVNVEHTWPQSDFSRRYVKEQQKSDLHHLFPTDSEMNSRRSSYAFGEVELARGDLKCENSKLGESRGGNTVFEPPSTHRGNVARAMFYFAVRYEMTIPAEEEATLRAWHKADPVDPAEMKRNDRIFSLQRNRNPFVDFPNLVDRIGDF